MSAELLEAYETLPEDDQKEVLDFVMFLKGRNNLSNSAKKAGKADALLAAFADATVNVPITWTREEIHERH